MSGFILIALFLITTLFTGLRFYLNPSKVVMELGSMGIFVGTKKNNNTLDHIVQKTEATPDGEKIRSQSSKANERLKLIIVNNTASMSNRVWMCIF